MFLEGDIVIIVLCYFQFRFADQNPKSVSITKLGLWHLSVPHLAQGSFLQNAKWFFDICNAEIAQCTEVQFASFFSGEFITAILVNPQERRLAKRTSVHCDISKF